MLAVLEALLYIIRRLLLLIPLPLGFMAKKTLPSQEALLLFPLSRRLKANNTRPFLKSCKHKRNKANVDDLNDWLSQLPDEIMIEILSRLTMKEAARVSLLSHKWRKVWRCYPILNFEDSRAMDKLWNEDEGVVAKERHEFARRVNRIVEQHLGQAIDEFRVTFDLNYQYRSHIDKWVAFAFAKQVKRLELDFTPVFLSDYKQYAWPMPLQNHISLEPPHNMDTWKRALTSLCLKYINITAEAVECFLSSFPFLEILCIHSSEILTGVRACSPLSLKRLEVIHCWGLNTIDVDAPKLLSLSYEGRSIKLHLRNASSLSVVSIGTLARNSLIAYAFDSLLNYCAQLEYLELKMDLFDELNWQIDQCPMLTNLKHLTLYVFADYESSLLGWTSLINASPVMQKLTLKLCVSGCLRGRKVRNCDGHPLNCLKTLEIVGLVGRCLDLEIAMYVLENAIMLEEVVLDARHPYATKDSKPDLMAQKRVMELSSKLPQGVKLVFK